MRKLSKKHLRVGGDNCIYQLIYICDAEQISTRNYSYIKCKIPFDEKVLALRQKNVGLNVGLNVALNKTEKVVLRLLIDNSDRNADMIAAEIGVTKRTIERAFASLQQKGKIERIGSKRDGKWVVIQ